jgi:hypothetical protein
MSPSHRCTDATNFLLFLFLADQHGWRQANLRAYQYFDTSPKLPMECETHTDRGSIISQVKNWITSWVNYCENEARYLKSFSLFTAFLDRPDVKELRGECHSYVMHTYIAVTWMSNKEKLLFYNRLTMRNVDQCTSCPAEHENSSMKWG